MVPEQFTATQIHTQKLKMVKNITSGKGDEMMRIVIFITDLVSITMIKRHMLIE